MFAVRPTVLFLAAFLFVSLSASAGEVPRVSLGAGTVQGAGTLTAKAGGDTINLMSTHADPNNEPGEPYYYGDFEDESGLPDWNGWTHVDLTQPPTITWSVSNYNQPDPGNHAAWCGDIDLPSCDGGATDPVGGYGNNWNSVLEFRQAVPHPAAGSTVTITATLIHDTEPGYDYTYLSYRYQGDSYQDLQTWDGAGTEAVSAMVSYLPEEYVDGTDIAVYFRFTSDPGWSDEDCMFTSAGACQIDDINVHLANDAFDGDYFEDFEHGGVPDDFGLWNPVLAMGVGDFAKIWTYLEDVDPCATNYSPQVAFIDDGNVVPGTGGSWCIDWCYGPGGYIVTTDGGLTNGRDHIHNAIESPVMDWPAAKTPGDPDPDGISLAFSVFRHEDLSADSPGIFFTWAVRSADTDNSAGNGSATIENQAWEDRNFVYYGGPEYTRFPQNVTELMNPGRDQVQVQLAVYQLGWVWNWTGDDGYPAPYFDDVIVKVFPVVGPAMSARDIDLAQDNFPERGSIDYADLGSHSVRFDMANNISPADHLRNDPGDSLVVEIVSLRSGADLVGPPVLHYILDPNPLFDAYRSAGLPNVGWTAGQPAVGDAPTPRPYTWAFDLPDTGFLFPGDVLHYYIKAADAIGGTDMESALLPADTTGFSSGFANPRDYPALFTMRALPSLDPNKDVFFSYELLFINDGASGENRDKWLDALEHHGMLGSGGYDIYHVNGPTSGVGNGIGGRANADLLSFYTDILYTSGDLEVRTIANGDLDADPGDDVGALSGWLDQDDKDLFLAGDGLAADLDQSGSATGDFMNLYMGVSLVNTDIRQLISNQATPRVKAVYGGTPQDNIFPSDYSWIAYGGCPGVNRFDGVEVMGLAVREAEFLDPSGGSGTYPYSAVTLNHVGSSRVVSMPLDLAFVYADPASGTHPSLGAADFLEYLLGFFDIYPIGDVPGGDTVPNLVFRAENHPNPFNPATTITYSLPRAGHFKLRVYDVRGRLVKTLIDGVRPAGANQTIIWDGTDNHGSAAASGLYFYEARAAGEVKIGKMTLLK